MITHCPRPRACGRIVQSPEELSRLLAARLVEWAANIVLAAGKSLWIVADGAYAKRPFLRRAAAAGVAGSV
jgi:hypothetical protein